MTLIKNNSPCATVGIFRSKTAKKPFALIAPGGAFTSGARQQLNDLEEEPAGDDTCQSVQPSGAPHRFFAPAPAESLVQRDAPALRTPRKDCEPSAIRHKWLKPENER